MGKILDAIEEEGALQRLNEEAVQKFAECAYILDKKVEPTVNEQASLNYEKWQEQHMKNYLEWTEEKPEMTYYTESLINNKVKNLTEDLI